MKVMLAYAPDPTDYNIPELQPSAGSSDPLHIIFAVIFFIFFIVWLWKATDGGKR